jgi:hypothetical protein
MKKAISNAFGKTIYFLGKDEYGQNLWLEEPRWDCDWYWGFGYVESYTNNKSPHLARDISSHSHFDGLVWYKNDKGNYVYHIKEVMETPLTEDESWQLSDLMKRFYSLRETAEIFHRGSSNFTSVPSVDSTNKELEKYINEVELPKIFKGVIDLLSPK